MDAIGILHERLDLCLAVAARREIELIGLADQLDDSRKVELIKWRDRRRHLETLPKFLQRTHTLLQPRCQRPGAILLSPVGILGGERAVSNIR